jgi:hypothetical protein
VVDHLAGDPRLDLLGGESEPEASCRSKLCSLESNSHERALAITVYFLLTPPTLPGKQLDMTSGCVGFASAESLNTAVDPDGDDECSVGMMVEDGPAGGITIVQAVSQHCGNRAGDLDEKRTDHGGFALIRGAT